MFGGTVSQAVLLIGVVGIKEMPILQSAFTVSWHDCLLFNGNAVRVVQDVHLHRVLEEVDRGRFGDVVVRVD